MRKFFFFSILISFTFLTSCASYEDVQFKGIKNVGIAGKDKDGLKLNVTIGVKNPNSMKIKIKNADMQFAFNGRTLGNLELDKKVVVPKNSDGNIDLVINVQSQELLKGGIGALLSTVLTQKAEVSMKGTVKAKASIFSRKIPVNITERIQMPKL